MSSGSNNQLKLAVLATVFMAVGWASNPVWASSSRQVDIKVKIGICGNGIVEANEQCDGRVVDDTSCQSLGYSDGNLACDAACSFDVSDCVNTMDINNPESLTPKPTKKIARAIELYDLDKSGKIDVREIYSVITTWLFNRDQSIKENCDMDQDGYCDLVDFSILLYYIDR